MSVPTPPGIDPSLNPKAAAKAAAAYAKASRPWFKKKRYWIIAAILIIAIAGGTAATKKDGPKVVDSKGNTTSTGTNNGSPAVGTKENPAKIGTKIELAGTRYTVTAAKTAQSVGGSQYSDGQKADGIFVVVTLTIENVKTETKTFSSSSTAFVASAGASYDPSTDAMIYASMDKPEPLSFEDMQPNLPKTGNLYFDVPPTALKGGLLKVSDLFGDGEAYIALNLK